MFVVRKNEFQVNVMYSLKRLARSAAIYLLVPAILLKRIDISIDWKCAQHSINFSSNRPQLTYTLCAHTASSKSNTFQPEFNVSQIEFFLLRNLLDSKIHQKWHQKTYLEMFSNKRFTVSSFVDECCVAEIILNRNVWRRSWYAQQMCYTLF